MEEFPQISSETLNRLNVAYKNHSPEFPLYAYGGSVNVPGINELFNRTIRNKNRLNWTVVDYGSWRYGGRIKIFLPLPKETTKRSVKVSLEGNLFQEKVDDVLNQFIFYLEHPESEHEFWA